MISLKFNKSELVNLSYSLRREVLEANKTGAYCNTSIVDCNTRKYHGLLAVTLDRFGGDRFMLLSSLDERLVVNGKQFNLGIHCYGGIYEPRGHKYVVDFAEDPTPSITYKVGDLVLRKSFVFAHSKHQFLIRYELLEAPSAIELWLKPFLAFRNIHDLTHQNDVANTAYGEVHNGVSFRMYSNFPDLNIQLSRDSKFVYTPCWNNNITYSDEYRRGFDCREDLFTPGHFELKIKPGDTVYVSASIEEENPANFARSFKAAEKAAGMVNTNHEQLVRSADMLLTDHNARKKVEAGYSWMQSGLLRETLVALPGLTLHGKGSANQFEEILDNLVADQQERLFRRTTQVEAPLYLASVLQKYIASGADPKKVWAKYGIVVRGILESYLPGERKEVAMHPNGLLWAQMDNVALTWMNAYIHGKPVTERAGYQVETNAFWYNSIAFAVMMEEKYGSSKGQFVRKWREIRDLVKSNFMPVFWNTRSSCLADYVDGFGQNEAIRPNQIYAIWVENSPVDEDLFPRILRVIDSELVTSRGIRTLSPRDVNYKGVYEGTQIDRDLAYHQGCTRPFLLEPYIEVSLKIKGPAFLKRAEWLVEGFYADLNKHGVGAFAELYDGDPPHEPHGAIASALSTAALLTVDYLLDKYKEA